MKLTKQDVAAIAGLFGATAVQIQTGFGSLHALIPALVGGAVLVAHILTGGKLTPTQSADVEVALTDVHKLLDGHSAAITALEGKVAAWIEGIRSHSHPAMGASLTALSSELDMVRRVLASVTTPTQPADIPVRVATTTEQPQVAIPTNIHLV